FSRKSTCRREGQAGSFGRFCVKSKLYGVKPYLVSKRWLLSDNISTVRGSPQTTAHFAPNLLSKWGIILGDLSSEVILAMLSITSCLPGTSLDLTGRLGGFHPKQRVRRLFMHTSQLQSSHSDDHETLRTQHPYLRAALPVSTTTYASLQPVV